MNIRVAEPITPAYESMKRFLFQPFDLGRWFNVGVCAWLAALGSGGGLNFPSQSFSNFNRNSSGENSGAEVIGSYLSENFAFIAGAAIVLLVFFIVIGFVLSWLAARGQFMLLDNIVYERAEVSTPWSAFKRQANSLFAFKVVYGIASTLVFLPILFFIVIGGFNYFNLIGVIDKMEQYLPASMLHITPGTTMGLVLVFVVLAAASAVVLMCLDDFVVLVMYRSGLGVMESWSKFLPILSANIGAFFLYAVFRLMLLFAAGMGIGVLIVCTCFLAACFIVIPYLGTVVTLPIPVFFRNYSIHFLRQFGPDFDALSGPGGAVIAPGAPAPLEDRPPQGSGDPANPYNPYR